MALANRVQVSLCVHIGCHPPQLLGLLFTSNTLNYDHQLQVAAMAKLYGTIDDVMDSKPIVFVSTPNNDVASPRSNTPVSRLGLALIGIVVVGAH